MKVQFLLKSTGMHERLGIMLLSSILKQHGHTVQLVLTGELREEECIAKVKDFDPQVLAYSVMTGEHNYYIGLNEMLRRHHDCLSVFGGPHPTFMPDMVEQDSVDAVCRGEGDIYFLQLVERLEHGQDFYGTPNFWFKKPDGEIVQNAMGQLVEDLDALPFPDRDLMYAADPALRNRGLKVFMAMRGCPYQCTYCFNHAYNAMTKGKGKVLRHRSVDSIIAEIRDVKDRYFLDRVIIDDDTFMLKPKGWVEEFAEKYPKEIGLPLTTNARANLVDDAVGQLLVKMGCRYVYMGVECGNDEVALTLLKRQIKNEDILRSFETFHKYKIKVMTQNLIGLPVDDPLAIDLETLDLNIKLKPDFGWSSILYPYPETELGKIAAEKGMFDESFAKIGVSNKTDSSLDFGDPKLKRRIVNLHKLFGIIVQFPFLRPLTLFLISLPLTRFYTWVFFAFYGYKVIRQSSMRGLLRALWYYPIFYVKYVSQLEKRVTFSRASQKQTYPVPSPSENAEE